MTTADRLDRDVRRALWALPVWALLLFVGTLRHQPSYQTDFAGYASFTTTVEFLVSHLVASIPGAAMGTLGFFALSLALAYRRRMRLTSWALVTSVVGNTLVTAVFGVAAFAQPAIGRAYRAGRTDGAVAINDDVYGTPLLATALVGVLLLAAGVVGFGVAVARSGALPAVAGIVLAVGGPVFGLVGFVLANFVQSIGAGLLVVGTTWVAWAARNVPVTAPTARMPEKGTMPSS